MPNCLDIHSAAVLNSIPQLIQINKVRKPIYKHFNPGIDLRSIYSSCLLFYIKFQNKFYKSSFFIIMPETVFFLLMPEIVPVLPMIHSYVCLVFTFLTFSELFQHSTHTKNAKILQTRIKYTNGKNKTWCAI